MNDDEIRLKYSKISEEIAVKTYGLIIAGLGDVTPQNRWLLCGRVLNRLFCHHYGFAINTASEIISSSEAEALKTKIALFQPPGGAEGQD